LFRNDRSNDRQDGGSAAVDIEDRRPGPRGPEL